MWSVRARAASPRASSSKATRVSGEVELQAAIAFRDEHSQKPQLGQLVEDTSVERPVPVPVRRPGYDLAFGELAGEFLDRALLGGQEGHRDRDGYG